MLNEGTAHQPPFLPLPSHAAVRGVASAGREREMIVQHCTMLRVVLPLSCPPGFPKHPAPSVCRASAPDSLAAPFVAQKKKDTS